MRLAVFTNQFPGRVNTFFARDMRALIENGIELDIFPIYPLDSQLWRHVPDILNESVLPRNHVHHIRIDQSLQLKAKLSHSLNLQNYLRDVSKITASAFRFGMIPVIKSLYIFPIALVLAKLCKNRFDHILAYWGNYAATCAYLVHRLTDSKIPFSMFLHAGTDLYRNQVFLQQKLLYADNIITVCDFNNKFIQTHLSEIYEVIKEKIIIHHLGINFEEYPYQENDPARYNIISVGSLFKLKGFDYLIRAVHLLKSRGIEIYIDLVGDGKEKNSLESLAKELRIYNNVRFWGWKDHEEVRSLIQKATALVHPSSDLGDAVPTVIKESIALGTPVIASDIAGIPELLDNGRCGILVPPKDVESLASAIEKLLTNASLRRKYAKAGRKYAEEKFDLWRNGHNLAVRLISTKRPSLYEVTHCNKTQVKQL